MTFEIFGLVIIIHRRHRYFGKNSHLHDGKGEGGRTVYWCSNPVCNRQALQEEA